MVTLGDIYVVQKINQSVDGETIILHFGEFVNYHSIDSTVGFVYNMITSSGI